MIWKWILQNLAKLNMKAYFVFLIITTIIWLMMKLSDNYNRYLELQINFTDLPKGKTIIGQSDSTIKVFVSAEGFKMLSLSGNAKQAFDVSVKNVKFTKQPNETLLGIIQTTDLRQMINSQLGVVMSDKNIQPEYISFSLDEIDTVEIPIIYRSQLQTAPGFRQYGEIKIIPSTVQAIGPRHVLDTLRFIEMQQLKLNNLTTNFKKEVKLNSPNASIKMNIDEAEIDVEIVEFIDAETVVPITVLSKIPGLKVKTFPSTVKLTYQVAMPDYKLINENMFTVAVEIDSMAALRHSSLIPNLIKSPKGVENIRLSTEKVEFVILKK